MVRLVLTIVGSTIAVFFAPKSPSPANQYSDCPVIFSSWHLATKAWEYSRPTTSPYSRANSNDDRPTAQPTSKALFSTPSCGGGGGGGGQRKIMEQVQVGGIEYSYKKGMLYKTNCQALSFPRKYLIALHAPSPAFPVGMQLIVHTSRTDTTGCKRVLLRADLALWLPYNYLIQHHPLQYYYVQTWLCGCPIIICYNTTLCNTITCRLGFVVAL